MARGGGGRMRNSPNLSLCHFEAVGRGSVPHNRQSGSHTRKTEMSSLHSLGLTSSISLASDKVSPSLALNSSGVDFHVMSCGLTVSERLPALII